MNNWSDLHGEPNNHRRITGREYDTKYDCQLWDAECLDGGNPAYCNDDCPEYAPPAPDPATVADRQYHAARDREAVEVGRGG